MLSAQKQEMPNDDTAPESSRPPTASGFGKVLSSIQGLQQRLDDFSVEEVSRAHAKAHDLIRQLGELQARLNALAKLKDALAGTNADIRAMPEDNFDLVGPDSLEKHPQLRAIVQAGKLIRMHRLLSAARASAESVSFDFQTNQLNNEPSSSLISPVLLPGISPRPEKEPLVAPGDGDISASASPASAETASERSSSPSISLSLTQEPQAAPTYEFADLKLDQAPTTAPLRKEDAPPSAKPGRDHVARVQGKKPAGKAHFDQRLLKDLIDSYGEFALPKDPSSGGETSEKNLPAPEDALSEPAQVPVDLSTNAAKPIESAGTELMLLEPASVEIASTEPAFVRPMAGGVLTLPAPEQKINRPAFEDALPNVKSRGEIDRQLKSIIKDYGEYDLYSHQKSKSTNIKNAAIAAVTVLGLVVGGLYFFKAPSSPAPAAVETLVPAGQPAVAEQPSGAKPNLKQKN